MERKRPASVEFTRKTKREVKEQYGEICYACGQPKDSPLHQGCIEVHHGRPAARGGGREPENAFLAGKGYCHQLLDTLALKYGIYFTMEPGQEYTL